MRIQIIVAVATSLVAAQASASSILVVENGPKTTSRSVIVVPQVVTTANSIERLEADSVAEVSRSVVAVGEPLAVSQEQVAAINGSGRNASTGRVMRGGVYGEALPVPVVEEAPVKELSRPAQRKKERDERRAIREAIRLGQPLPQKAETQPDANQPVKDQESGT